MRVAYLPAHPERYEGLESTEAIDRRRLGALIPYWEGRGIDAVPWTPSVSCDVVYVVSLQDSMPFLADVLAPSREYAVVGGVIEDPFYARFAAWPTDDLRLLRRRAEEWFRGPRGVARRLRRFLGQLGLECDPGVSLLRAIQRCDGIVTTSEGQSTMVRQLNLNVMSVADPIPESDYRGLVCSYTQPEPASIVWEGTAWGLQLVELIRPALEVVYERSRVEVEFLFVGPAMRPTPLFGSHSNNELLERRYALPTRRVDWRLDSIGRVLSHAAVGIAPMPTNNPFYRNKAFSKPLSYMACGLPVVASRVPSYEKVIEPGRTGFLAGPLDEWTSTLLRLVNSPDERRLMGTEALAKSAQFSAKEAAVRMMRLFRLASQLR